MTASFRRWPVVSKIWSSVDNLLKPFISYEDYRITVQMLLWMSLILLFHNLVERYALLIVMDFILFYSFPWFVASEACQTYLEFKENQPPYQEDPLKFAIGAYVLSLLVLIGIPHLFGGLIIQMVKSNIFQSFYWFFANLWFVIFNFAHPTKPNFDAFHQSMVISYNGLILKLLLGFGIIAPAVAFSLYPGLKEKRAKDRELEVLAKAKREREFEEKERERRYAEYNRIERAHEGSRLGEEFKLKRDANHASAITAANAETERLKRERKSHLEQIEIEKKRKVEARIQEVKGKNPWDSDFI